MLQQPHSYTLDNFEGTLTFLLSLLYRDELNIQEIPITSLTHQYMTSLKERENESLDEGAEFIWTTAYLIWLKNRTLLPNDTPKETLEEMEEDPHFEIIHHLVDYCRFKQAAKVLSERYESQSSCFYRGIPVGQVPKKPLGIDHISL